MLWNSLKSVARRRSLLESYHLAQGWIARHCIEGAKLPVSSKNLSPYPEVTGYFIPTLIACGERQLACSCARWLASIQNRDGSWSDPEGTSPYTFDTGQILKGLSALVETLPELETPLRRGCDWLLTQVLASGRVVTPDTSQWGLPGNRTVPEAIHLYALSPLREAGERFGERRYLDAVQRALVHYCADPELTSFSTLSHFHAYILEALVDLGREELALRAMQDIARIQRMDGSVPGYSNVGWVCSTGLFQYALIWYKLAELPCADRAFAAAVRLQNRSGGFFGSYGWGANYFPRQEISWAVKYFLDAFWRKVGSSFDSEAEQFPESVAAEDGRYQLVAGALRQSAASSVLEAGCGKGRFLRRLAAEFPGVRLSGLDLSPAMLASLPEGVAPLRGTLLDLPVADASYDLVFTVEALEHAVHIPHAVRELARAVAPGGTLVIVDKNRERLGALRISDWEQWFRPQQVTALLREQGFTVRLEHGLPYDGEDGSDGLFLGWVATRPLTGGSH